jgi:hypothetical protein
MVKTAHFRATYALILIVFPISVGRCSEVVFPAISQHAQCVYDLSPEALLRTQSLFSYHYHAEFFAFFIKSDKMPVLKRN